MVTPTSQSWCPWHYVMYALRWTGSEWKPNTDSCEYCARAERET